MDDHEHKWAAVVVFPDQSPSFANGMEAGALWERMKTTSDEEFEQMVNSDNVEVVRLLAAHYGWRVDASETESDDWTMLVFTRVQTN